MSASTRIGRIFTASTLRAPLVGLAVLVATSASTGAAALTPQADFATRCAAPGILVCEGFDDAADFVYSPYQADGLYPPWGSSVVGGYQDTGAKTSGASSLRFDIHGQTGDDTAGNFSKNFGVTFSQNSTFYVQFRQRFDNNMATRRRRHGTTNWRLGLPVQN